MANAISSRAMKSFEEATDDNTLGAVFLGVIGSGVLFGVTCLQVYIYYHRFLKDSALHKILVAVLWILDALHLALTVHVVYHYLVSNFGNHAEYPNIIWSLKLQVAVNVVIILIVQSLYAYRVWLLGGYHHGILGYLVASVVAGGFAIGIILAYQVYSVDTFAKLEDIAWAINASLATSTTIDFLISSAMCYYLWKSKCNDSRSRLNSRISTVMQYTLCSGLLTSACSLSTLFTYNLMPNNFIFLGLEFLLTKLYVGSFLAMLNARKSRHRKCKNETADDDSSSLAFRSLNFKIQTTIQTETHRGSYVPSSASTSQSGDSTYVSFDDRAKNWDIESQTLPLEEAVLPGRQCTVVAQQKQRPDYMAQW